MVTDKAPSLSCAFKLLRSQGYFIYTIHRTSKYLNNIIEQDHQSIKKRYKLYKSVRTASTTIKGIETIHALFKKKRKEGNLFGFSVTLEMNKLLGISA